MSGAVHRPCALLELNPVWKFAGFWGDARRTNLIGPLLQVETDLCVGKNIREQHAVVYRVGVSEERFRAALDACLVDNDIL
jgi:hypothetical protein